MLIQFPVWIESPLVLYTYTYRFSRTLLYVYVYTLEPLTNCISKFIARDCVGVLGSIMGYRWGISSLHRIVGSFCSSNYIQTFPIAIIFFLWEKVRDFESTGGLVCFGIFLFTLCYSEKIIQLFLIKSKYLQLIKSLLVIILHITLYLLLCLSTENSKSFSFWFEKHDLFLTRPVEYLK